MLVCGGSSYYESMWPTCFVFVRLLTVNHLTNALRFSSISCLVVHSSDPYIITHVVCGVPSYPPAVWSCGGCCCWGVDAFAPRLLNTNLPEDGVASLPASTARHHALTLMAHSSQDRGRSTRMSDTSAIKAAMLRGGPFEDRRGGGFPLSLGCNLPSGCIHAHSFTH